VTYIIRERLRLAAPEPGQPGAFALADPHKLEYLLRDAGFTDIAIESRSMPLAGHSLDECLQWRRESSAQVQNMLQGVDPDEEQRIWDAVRAAWSVHETPTGLVLPCEVLIASAMR
jgi:hypothetical protein